MTILQVENLTKRYVTSGGYFDRKGETITALDDVSFEVRRGESIGIVGESGSGKSTLSRIILGLEMPDSGRIVFDGTDLSTLSKRELRAIRARIQVVFQDPYASLNPRMSVRDLIAEPMEIHRDILGMSNAQITDRVAELLTLVRMEEDHMHRYPHEFSGGQRQRIGIARALACKPQLVVLDEPTSALDVSVQAQVLALLIGLQDELNLTYLFISHDLAVVRYLCQSAILIRKGKLVENAPIDDLFDAPKSDYGRMLIGAMPDIDPDKSPFRVKSQA
ncbi:MAG: ABC transporter ATP-binding protein [Rhizobiaceae bacterium]|nr:ABC transporter ATP-binding protein [Rhizobiaceae bacterium]